MQGSFAGIIGGELSDAAQGQGVSTNQGIQRPFILLGIVKDEDAAVSVLAEKK
jgi:hypothetical protein